MRARRVWLELGAGVVLIALTAFVQFSSLATPYLAGHPPLLLLVSSGGVYLLCLAALDCILLAAWSHSWRWIAGAGGYLLLAGLVRSSALLTAFQLLLSGLTVGGGLVGLACTHMHTSLRKRP